MTPQILAVQTYFLAVRLWNSMDPKMSQIGFASLGNSLEKPGLNDGSDSKHEVSTNSLLE